MNNKLKLYDSINLKSKGSKSIYQEIDKYIQSNYIIRFNEISLSFEIAQKKDLKFETLNESSLLISMVNNGIKVSHPSLKTYLTSDYISSYNPIKNYLENLPFCNKIDYISQFASYVDTDDNLLFSYHLKKWCVRAVLSVFHTDKINKHCIVLANGAQHAGKSTYLNYLIPIELQSYSSENIGIDKDSRIKLCKTFLINLEELDIMGRDVNSIKAFLSQTWVNERLPYADKSTNIPRICSFIGSTNRTEFLNDDTGSVRWIIFNVKGKLNFKYSKEFDINNLWAQAYHLAFQDKSFKSDLTDEDVKVNEKRNEAYMIQTIERELIPTYYEPSLRIEDFRTPTEIVEELRVLGHRLNNQRIGSALTRYNFQRIKHGKRQIYGYLAKPLFKDSPLDLKLLTKLPITTDNANT